MSTATIVIQSVVAEDKSNVNLVVVVLKTSDGKGRLLRVIATAQFPDRFDFTGWQPPVHSAAAFVRMLSPFGQVDAWETEYIQRLAPDPQSAAHPVRLFAESTAMRPFLNPLTSAEASAFIARYDAALADVLGLQFELGLDEHDRAPGRSGAGDRRSEHVPQRDEGDVGDDQVGQLARDAPQTV